MDIIIPHRIKKKELGGEISDEARKIFEKLKEKSAIAPVTITTGVSDKASSRLDVILR